MEIKRKVMCTSTGCIEYAPERYKKYDIDIIRIHVHFKGKEYLEGLDLDPDAFYRELEVLEDAKNNLPKTAMPSPEKIREHFQKAYDDGYREVIVIAISAYLGGTYNLIRLTAEEFADKMNIIVIDSKITCFGEGMLAIKAAEMIEKGIPTETILKEIAWMMKHQEFLGVDAKLDYLIYNGRLKGGKALMGKMLNICPRGTFHARWRALRAAERSYSQKGAGKDLRDLEGNDRRPRSCRLSALAHLHRSFAA